MSEVALTATAGALIAATTTNTATVGAAIAGTTTGTATVGALIRGDLLASISVDSTGTLKDKFKATVTLTNLFSDTLSIREVRCRAGANKPLDFGVAYLGFAAYNLTFGSSLAVEVDGVAFATGTYSVYADVVASDGRLYETSAGSITIS